MHRDEFRRLATKRKREAKHLLNAGCYEGAYYLGGYVVELALKACIAKRFLRHTWPYKGFEREIFNHDLTRLLKAAKLEGTLEGDCANDGELFYNWSIVKDWSVESRYALGMEDEARILYNAVVARRGGMLPWIKRYW